MEQTKTRLLIHVGLPKTGTTSLQVALKTAEDADYIYDPALKMSQSRHFSNAVGIGQDVLKRGDQLAWRARFAERMKTGDKPAVVSDETLSQVSRLDRGAIVDLLRKTDGNIRIVIVVRPFFSWLESLLNQFTKNGRVDIVTFNPDTDDTLNAYDIDFLRIYSAYTDIARQVGARCQVSVLRYSRSINREICAIAGISPACLESQSQFNTSLTPQAAMQSFIEIAGLEGEVDRSVELPDRFIGRDELERLHTRHKSWMKELANTLQWPLEDIDDYGTFAGEVGEDSLLKFARDLLARGKRASQSDLSEEKENSVSEDVVNSRMIKGVLARALLRVELKLESGDEPVSQEAFQAAWTERRDALLDTAGLVRQNLKRQGIELVELPKEQDDNT